MPNLAPNVEILPGYRLVRPLGRGGFGEVWEAEAPGGMSKAIKVASLANANAALSNRELEGLQKVRAIRHPYLLSLERFEVVDGFLLIVSELADKNLADRFSESIKKGLPGINRNELLHYLREASEVLDLLNKEYGLQHLDIKPENLFLSGKHVKVADFGLVQSGGTRLNTEALAFSAPYASPELFEGRVEPTADQYSLAVTYQELLSGCRPYVASDVRGLLYEHLKGSPNLNTLPVGDRPILNKAYKRDARRRYSSCTELIYALINVSDPGPLPDRSGAVSASRNPAATSGGVIRANSIATEAITAEMMQPKSMSNPYATTQISAAQMSTVQNELPRLRKVSGLDHLQQTIVAPISIDEYEQKLKNFIDDSKAEIASAAPEKTVLQFRAKGGFFKKSNKVLFLKLEATRQTTPNGSRTFDVSVWASENHLNREELIRRGSTMIRCIKTYLLNPGGVAEMLADPRIRIDLFGG